jgi:hypothetical protein
VYEYYKVKIYAIIGLLTLTTLASAYFTGQTANIYALYTEDGIPVSGYANLTFYFPNGTAALDNVGMSEYSTGRYSYPYTFPEVPGGYVADVSFYNSSWDLQGVAFNTYSAQSGTGDLHLAVETGNELVADLLDLLGGKYVSAISPNGTTNLAIHYPTQICTDQPFVISASYIYNDNIIKDGEVLIGTDNAPYSVRYYTYRKEYEFSATGWFNDTIYATSTEPEYQNLSIPFSIEVIDCIGLNVHIWQERKWDIERGGDWVIQKRNFDKQLDTPYINDFAWIIARDVNSNATGLYSYCHLPIGGIGNYLSFFDNLLGSDLPKTIIDYIGATEYVGCTNRWFRAPYRSGMGSLILPDDGTYALYLLDGVLQWENEYAPPQVVKSNLFMPLGEVTLGDGESLYEVDFYVTHGEITGWTAIMEEYFIIFVILIPILILVASIILGAPMRFAIIITLVWIIVWTLIRLAS